MTEQIAPGVVVQLRSRPYRDVSIFALIVANSGGGDFRTILSDGRTWEINLHCDVARVLPAELQHDIGLLFGGNSRTARRVA